MKTRVKGLFLLAILCFAPRIVLAASTCNNADKAELNKMAYNVTANYEIVDIYDGQMEDFESSTTPTTIDNYVRGLRINILNITEDIYVKVTSKNDDTVKTYNYSDTENGIVSFETKDVEELNTYTIEVYSNKASCKDELQRTLTLQTPMFNFYSQLEICEGKQDYYYCQEFIPTERVTATYFYQDIENYEKEQEEKKNEENNKNFIDKLKEFYENNKLIIYSVGIVIVVAGVATTVILVKKKRSRRVL